MSAHGLMLDGRQVCNASVSLVAVYEDIASHELWLLMGVVLDEQFSLLWMASALDRLNLKREVLGCICVDERGRTTHRLIATFLRAQLAQPNLPRGMYLSQSGWHMLNNRHQYVTGAAAPQSIAVSTAGGTPATVDCRSYSDAAASGSRPEAIRNSSNRTTDGKFVATSGNILPDLVLHAVRGLSVISPSEWVAYWLHPLSYCTTGLGKNDRSKAFMPAV